MSNEANKIGYKGNQTKKGKHNACLFLLYKPRLFVNLCWCFSEVEHIAAVGLNAVVFLL